MVRYVDRSGNDFDPKNASIDTYGSTTQTIYGKGDIINIIFIGKNGVCYGVNPNSFREEYGGYTAGEKNINDSITCGIVEHDPINAHMVPRSIMGDKLSRKAMDEGAGAWANNGTTCCNSNYKISRWDNLNGIGLNWDLSKKFDSASDDKCTEFFILYNQVTAICDAGYYGYKMFQPQNYNHYQNWMSYENAKAGSYYNNFMIVMYLTLPDLVQTMAFLRGPEPPSAIKNLAKISNLNITNLINDSCTTTYPTNTKLYPGTYYFGTTIYSTDTEYKFIIQADGNCVIYKYDGSVKWSSGTFDSKYAFPVVTISNDMKVTIKSSLSRVSTDSKTIIDGIGQSGYLHLDAANGILNIRDNDWNIVRWSTADKQTNYDNNKNIKIFNTFTYQSDYKASDSIRKYSPNMKYYLIFQSDGNLVLYPTGKDSAEWSSATYGNPSAILSIQKDGNVIIYNDSTKSKVLWKSDTGGTNKSTFLMADDNGYAAIYTNNGYDRGGHQLRWWSKSGGIPYYNLVSGLQSNDLWNQPQPFSRACTTANYGDNKYDDQNISLAKGKYCATGLNMITDQANCSMFMEEPPEYSDNKKNINYLTFQKYIKPAVQVICADGYDKQYVDDPKMQTSVNNFCSCINPSGTSKRVISAQDRPIPAICFDNACINNGYHRLTDMTARATCPQAICINNMDLTNLQLANNIKQECTSIAGNKSATDVNQPIDPNKKDPVLPPPKLTETILFTDDNVFYYDTDYKASDNTIKKSPNGKYYLEFTKNGLALGTIDSQGNKISSWSQSIQGSDQMILSIQKDGNVIVYKDSSKKVSLWTSNTIKPDNKNILVIDNYGTAIILNSVNNNPMWTNNGIAQYNIPYASISFAQHNRLTKLSNTDLNTLWIAIGCLVGLILIVIILRRRSSFNRETNFEPPDQMQSMPFESLDQMQSMSFEPSDQMQEPSFIQSDNIDGTPSINIKQ